MNDFQSVLPRTDNAFISAARSLLGLFLLGTGVVTFFVPDIKVAFIGQLSAANIPLQQMSLFVIPMLEAGAGAMLLGGFMIRFASLVSVLIMALLTYLHLVVPEPSLYPLQFELPLMPIVALVLSAFLYFVDTYGDGD